MNHAQEAHKRTYGLIPVVQDIPTHRVLNPNGDLKIKRDFRALRQILNEDAWMPDGGKRGGQVVPNRAPLATLEPEPKRK